MQNIKTIFITIFEGVEVKNILRTPILENLLSKNDIRIVLFTKSQQKIDYYSKEFPDKRISFELVEWKSKSAFDRFFSKLKFVLLRTKTTNMKRKMVCEYEGKYFQYYSGRVLNFIMAWPVIRRVARYLDFVLVKDNTYSQYFDKYNPDLVFLAHLFDEPEVNLLREAKKRKVKTIGYINSWDKVTSRCILRLLPDKAIVFNDIVKAEMIEHNEMKEEDIFVSGLPQYDYFYSDESNFFNRQEFFNKISISPDKELLVYASMGRAFSTSDWDMIDFLHKLIETKGKLVKDCALLVRFQPNDFVDDVEIKKRPYLKYDQPGIRFGSKRGVDWDMNNADLAHLYATLKHMSILICYASSISVDAAVFDKPVININYEIKENNIMLKSPTQHYNSEHYKNALKTGAIDLVGSEDELVRSINSYLLDSSIKSKEREQLIKEQCTFTDGKSGERIANFILNIIK
jgi:CDP-glycerol glycerophosphotransferase (TagB/SpsB family)